MKYLRYGACSRTTLAHCLQLCTCVLSSCEAKRSENCIYPATRAGIDASDASLRASDCAPTASKQSMWESTFCIPQISCEIPARGSASQPYPGVFRRLDPPLPHAVLLNVHQCRDIAGRGTYMAHSSILIINQMERVMSQAGIPGSSGSAQFSGRQLCSSSFRCSASYGRVLLRPPCSAQRHARCRAASDVSLFTDSSLSGPGLGVNGPGASSKRPNVRIEDIALESEVEMHHTLTTPGKKKA